MFLELKKDCSRFDNICFLPTLIYNELKLDPQTKYRLNFGQRTEEVYIQQGPHEEGVFHLPSTLFDGVHWEGFRLNLWIKDGVLHIGPIVGVFMNTKYMRDMENGVVPQFIQNHGLASEHTGCLSYFFSIHDVDLVQQRIRGHLTFSGQWQKKWFPFPDVLYDRGASFSEQEKLLAAHIRLQLKSSPHLRVINNLDYLGKWELYKRLSKIPEVSDFLPETIKYKSFGDIAEMLEKYPCVFVKSYYGSRGREVMSIEREGRGYRIIFFDRDKLTNERVYQKEGLQNYIISFIKETRYVVQQGIKLMQYNERNFDIRILMEKDRCGKWNSVYDSINLARKEVSITTINGSDKYSYQDIYHQLLKLNHRVPSDKRLHEIASQICLGIEREFGSFGEIGLDVAVDRDGRIWLIEANSKPEKYPPPEARHCSGKPEFPFISTLEYAKFLSMGMPEENEKLTWKVTITKRTTGFNKEQSITVPDRLYKHLPKNQGVKIKIGMFECEVLCESSSFEDTVEFSQDLLEEFDGLLNIETIIKLDGSVIKFGPVIGMFISNGNIRKMKNQSPKFRQIEFVNANNKNSQSILYFFSIKDVNFIHQKIYGMCYLPKDNQWRRLSFPFPNVFYDRGGGVLSKQVVKSEYIRQQFSKVNEMYKINPQHYFDKWETHTRLVKMKEMQPYMPETVLYRGVDALKGFFKNHSQVYLKDCQGSNGRGIMRVVCLPEKEYECSYVVDRQLFEMKIEGLDQLATAIQSFFPGKKVIAQKAINLMTLDDRNIDLRATVQRNGLGQIDITSYPVRIGGSRSPVTSSQTGSEIYQFERFFEGFLQYPTKQVQFLKEKINQFLLICYTSIEKVFGIFGEIGIDFALDKEQKIWFIECNAKPGFDCMYMSYDRETIERTFTNPLEYAKYIVRF